MALVQSKEKVTCRLIRLWVTVLPWVLTVCGCGSQVQRPHTPHATISTAGGASVITQTGDAQTPAAVSVSSETRTVPLPSGSSIVFDEKAGTITLRLSRDSTLTTTARTERAVAPAAFAPPAPPTAAEVAQADGTRWFYLAAILAVIAAALLFYTGHALSAICVGAGGLFLPVLARFYTSTVALPLCAACVASGAGLWLAWYILARRHNLQPETK